MVEPQFLGRTGIAMDDLLNDFLAETAEILAEAGGAIVAWEADPADRAQLDAIFRIEVGEFAQCAAGLDRRQVLAEVDRVEAGILQRR